LAGYPDHYNRAFASFSILTQTAVSLPCGEACPEGDGYGVSTFRTVDPLDDLGVPFTPVVPQFRAGSYETCILTTIPHAREGPSTLFVPEVGSL
jgi:hypothetical protein